MTVHNRTGNGRSAAAAVRAATAGAKVARGLDLGSVDLDAIQRVDIDDMIDYVYAGTGPNLPSYLELYSRYLRQRWNVDDLDSRCTGEDLTRALRRERRPSRRKSPGQTDTKPTWRDFWPKSPTKKNSMAR